MASLNWATLPENIPSNVQMLTRLTRYVRMEDDYNWEKIEEFETLYVNGMKTEARVRDHIVCAKGVRDEISRRGRKRTGAEACLAGSRTHHNSPRRVGMGTLGDSTRKEDEKKEAKKPIREDMVCKPMYNPVDGDEKNPKPKRTPMSEEDRGKDKADGKGKAKARELIWGKPSVKVEQGSDKSKAKEKGSGNRLRIELKNKGKGSRDKRGDRVQLIDSSDNEGNTACRSELIRVLLDNC